MNARSSVLPNIPKVMHPKTGQVLAQEGLRKLFGELAACQVRVSSDEYVQAYLQAHPALVEVISGVGRTARGEFGPQAELTLQAYPDPEIHEEYLALVVRLSAYGPEMFTRLEKVMATHEKELAAQDGSLLITTDYRPPLAHAL